MKVPKYLYHATSELAWRSVQKQGLLPAFPAVYMTEDTKILPRFGTVFLKIDTKYLDKDMLGTYREILCDILKTSDFWHYYGKVPRKAIKKL